MTRPAWPLGMLEPATYLIVARSRLEPTWCERIAGMAVAAHDAPVGSITILIGELPDQSALHGVLKALYDLGLPVLAVAVVATARRRGEAPSLASG